MTQNYSLYRRREQSSQSKSQHVKTLRKGNRSAPYLNKNKGNAKRGYVPTGNKGITRIRQNSQLKRPDHDMRGGPSGSELVAGSEVGVLLGVVVLVHVIFVSRSNISLTSCRLK